MSSTGSKATSTFGIAATFVGTIIGAGFASGQEVLQYFVSFGAEGALAIVLAGVLFFGFGALAMVLGAHQGTGDYRQITDLGPTPLPRLFSDLFISLSLFGTFVIMVAGGGETFAAAFGVPPIVGSLVVGVLCVLNLMRGLDALVAVQSVLVPALVLGAIAVAVYSILNPIEGGAGDAAAEVNTSPLINQWTMAGILYVAFNIQLAIAVLVPLGARSARRSTLVWGALWGALGLGGGAFAVYTAMNTNAALVGTADLPMVDLAARIGPTWGLLYSVVLFVGLYTTAVSCFFGTYARLTRVPALDSAPRLPVLLVIAGVGIALSSVGFSDLISIVYPMLGYGGMGIMLIVLAVAWTTLRRPHRAA